MSRPALWVFSCVARPWGEGCEQLDELAGLLQENTRIGRHMLTKLFYACQPFEMNMGHTDMGPQPQLVCVSATLAV